MNNIPSYQDNIDLPDSGGLRHVENYSGSTSSAYDEVSPHMHNSTPGSNDSIYEKNNPSTISSKKSKNSNLSSDDNLNLTVDALEKTLTEDKTTKIKEIITLISNLSDTEKLLLQLQFPLSDLENLTFESSLNNMGFNNVDMIGSSTIMEQEEASKWVTSHLEINKDTCLQKQEVYEDYKSYCMTYNIKCLSTADFGKVMRKIFPEVRARRLGARGKSRYCYSGLRNRQETQSPMLKDIGMILESNDNVDNNNANSEVESYSSTSLLNNDLSNVPEYELSSNILIDSALVLLEFIKQVGVSKNIMSLKQAVKHILTNNQVDLRSPYATRLCSVFQQSDNNNKPYVVNKYSNEPVFNTIKKEETLISPCSVTPQRSSTTSPQNQKRRDMFNSPVPNKMIYCDLPKPQSDNSPIHTPQNLNRPNFNYNQTYYPQTLPPNMIPMPHHLPLQINSLRQDMSPASIINNGTQPKSFVHSTPVKNAPNIEIPQLNSPLLDNNPLTSKKLELNKYFNPANSVSSNLTSVPDNNSKLNLYYPHHDRSRSFTSTAYNSQELRRPPINSYINTSIDLLRNVDSPISMNTDYIHQPNQEFQELEDIDTCQTRFIDEGRTEINFQASPTHSINNENNYSMSSSHLCSIASPMKNDKPYLNTPDNSPNRNDPDIEDSSNCSQISIKRENFLSITKPGSKTLNYSSCFPRDSIPNYLYGVDRNCFFNTNFNINRSSDESNVTSTTSLGITDPDGHPSTTMRQSFIYNK